MLEYWQLGTCPTSVLTEYLSWPLQRQYLFQCLLQGRCGRGTLFDWGNSPFGEVPNVCT